MKHLPSILILLAASAFVLAQTGSVPPPPPTSPPDWPSNTTVVTNADGTYSLSEPVLSVPAPPVGREWELTFEWADNPAGTNAVAYPIRVQVPFEHDSGFVFVRARKVEVKP